jgi:hypothetical protein
MSNIKVANIWFVENMWDKESSTGLRSGACTVLSASGKLFQHYFHEGTGEWGWARIGNLPEEPKEAV